MFALPAATDPQAALDAARARWRGAAIADYRFHVQRSCFCPEPYRRRYVIRVRDGRPVGAPQEVRADATVPRLFRVVQAQIDGEGTVAVTYGATGLPRRVSADPIPAAVDDEFTLRAGGLRPLP